jgi:hypothetical protein
VYSVFVVIIFADLSWYLTLHVNISVCMHVYKIDICASVFSHSLCRLSFSMSGTQFQLHLVPIPFSLCFY